LFHELRQLIVENIRVGREATDNMSTWHNVEKGRYAIHNGVKQVIVQFARGLEQSVEEDPGAKKKT
jgi:hypothetical protein